MDSPCIKTEALFGPDILYEFSTFPKVLFSWNLKGDF